MVYNTVVVTEALCLCCRTRFLPLLPEENCLKVVVGAKLDLVTDDTKRAVSRQEARQFATEINQSYLEKQDSKTPLSFETSSKTGEGVTDAFEFAFSQCLAEVSGSYKIKRHTDTVDIAETTQTPKSTIDKPAKKCC